MALQQDRGGLAPTAHSTLPISWGDNTRQVVGRGQHPVQQLYILCWRLCCSIAAVAGNQGWSCLTNHHTPQTQTLGAFTCRQRLLCAVWLLLGACRKTRAIAAVVATRPRLQGVRPQAHSNHTAHCNVAHCQLLYVTGPVSLQSPRASMHRQSICSLEQSQG